MCSIDMFKPKGITLVYTRINSLPCWQLNWPVIKHKWLHLGIRYCIGTTCTHVFWLLSTYKPLHSVRMHITSYYQVEHYLGSRDDTALNGIRLVCSDDATVTSTVGGYGYWQGHVACRQHHSYLTAFSLQVESYVGDIILN